VKKYNLIGKRRGRHSREGGERGGVCEGEIRRNKHTHTHTREDKNRNREVVRHLRTQTQIKTGDRDTKREADRDE
jgi:hypothetical protein